MAAGGRVSIPAGAWRTVADIKEIAGGHTDEEVYTMLRECNMDPNETAQRLLLEDTFHEVKRKRDKKKEGNKEPSDYRWRPAVQGRGGKSGRDSAGRSAISGKENGISLITGKGSRSTPIINGNMDAKASTFMPRLVRARRAGLVQLVSASSPSRQNSKPSLCRISAGARLCFSYSLPQTPLVWEPLALGLPFD